MANQLYKGDTPLATKAPKDASELPYSNGVSVKDKIDGLIQSVDISGVTNQYGNIELSTTSADYILPIAVDTNTNYPFTIFKATGNSRWHAHFIDWDGSAKASLSVSGKFYYYTK